MSSRARHCLTCGARLRTAQEEGRRRRRCPRCGWTFYDNPVPAAVAVVTGPRGILLARRATPPHRGTWDLPGGFLEAGELPAGALARELHEELGARAAVRRFLGFFTERYGPRGFPILVAVYVARLRDRPSARSDVAEVRWFAPRALPWREIAFPSVRHALRAYLASR
jgi:ADP-ribose pyrophosphatase YjhB (NUDIX family)